MGAYLTGFVCVCAVLCNSSDSKRCLPKNSTPQQFGKSWLTCFKFLCLLSLHTPDFLLFDTSEKIFNKQRHLKSPFLKNFILMYACLLFLFPSLTSSSQASITRISATVLNLSLRRLVCDAGYRHRLGRLHHSERHGALPHPLPEPPQPHPQHVHHQQWDWRHCYGGSRPGQRGQCKLCVLCSRYLHRGFTLHLICVHAIKQLWRFGYVIHV